MKKILVLMLFVSINWFSYSSEEIIIFIPSDEIQLRSIEDVEINNVIKIAEDKLKMGKGNEGLSILNNAVEKAQGELKGKLINKIGYIKYKMKDYSGAEQAWKSVSNGIIQSSEQDISKSKLMLGYLKYAEKKYETSLDYFLDIATGIIKADKDTATDASLRTAFLFKKLNNPNKSLSIFTQIATQSSDKKISAYAKLQSAGLLWEMGKEEKNKEKATNLFMNSRNVCLEIINNPEITDDMRVEGSCIKIIAELIYLETYYFLKDYEKTIELCDQFINKWVPILNNILNYDYQDIERPYRRQIITALTWKAMCCMRLKRYDECLDICKEINSGKWDEEDPYKNFNVFGYALLYESLIYKMRGLNEKADEIDKFLIEKYNNWYKTIRPQEERYLLEN